MSSTGVTGLRNSFDIILPDECNKRKREEGHSFSVEKMRKVESAHTECFPLVDLPLELLCYTICQVAKNNWFNKSLQNMLSVNKNFHGKVMAEVLKFDGLREGGFASEILSYSEKHPKISGDLSKMESKEDCIHSSSTLLSTDVSVRNCIKKIDVENISVEFSDTFPNCRVLTISKLAFFFSCNIGGFKNLQVLKMLDCSFLSEFFFQSIENPTLQKITLKKCIQLSNTALQSISEKIKLRKLDLEDCHMLSTIPDSSLPILESLRLANCPQLTQESFSALTAMTKIQRLTLETQREPVTFDFSSSSSDLEEFTIKHYPNLTSLTFSNLSRFQKLTIEDCPELALVALSNLPNIQEVVIKSGMDGGNISSIEMSELPTLLSVKTSPTKIKLAFSDQL